MTGALGINDEFCYVNKFQFDIIDGIVQYKLYGPFQLVVIIVYSIRVINFIGTIFFVKKIIAFIRKEGESKTYLFKTIFIPLIQLFTIFIGVAYRVINLLSPIASVNLSGTYLILNTSDGVLFPIGFLFQNNIFEYAKRLLSKQEKEHLIEFEEKAQDDADDEE